ncbi:NUDIX hydrolase [Microvirga sp. ACRRW]|uniref:NUDIX hydrolase n=1 Tax=Microvirga sp. ACRRW TaxID=2918205 RepID=UPI001EF5A1E4|nr:NUDIX hydrolase [Microvirga sp. ACRRW]MCG7394021.1 NUDIX hydrolase [Microvirga sp. ACRRW]
MDTLVAGERKANIPTLRPVDAATLIIIDRKGKHAKVLMGKRHDGHKFMPGKFVFPGGRIEAGDRSMTVTGALHPRAEEALMAKVTRPSVQRSRALALAAIRETFEETGLMLGTRDYGSPNTVPAGTPWEAFREHGVFPDLEELHFIGRAITPPKRVKRFDTRFFAVDRTAIAHEVEGVVSPDSELVELAWVTVAEARKLDLPPITGVLLSELEARIAAGFSPMLPVPFFHQKRGHFVRELL